MSTLIDDRIGETLWTLLETITEPVLVVNPSEAVVEEIVDVASEMEDAPAIQLLAAESILKEVVSDFLVASRAADLVAGDTLALRTADIDVGNELLVTEDRLTALVTVGDEIGALSTEEEEFVALAHRHYAGAWESATPYSLRTPPLSRVRETLRDEIGPDAEADFTAVLDSLETARGDGEGLDEVTISLLIAAKNEELLYDISKWGEDVGIASKATFSRTKTMLEELGLIDTEKVPIDVGRPRLRLKFAKDRLRDASENELASVAQGLMA